MTTEVDGNDVLVGEVVVLLVGEDVVVDVIVVVVNVVVVITLQSVPLPEGE